MDSVKKFIHEVVNCGCESFEDRRKLLLPTFLISSFVTLAFYVSVIFPIWGFDSVVTKTHLIGSNMVLVGFLASMFMAKRVVANPILAFPSIASTLAAMMFLTNAEFYAHKNDVWMHYQIMSVIYASFLASIRCNLMIAAINIFSPIIIAANYDHVSIPLVMEKQGIVHVATLISFYLSYQSIIQKRTVYKKYEEAERLGREKADLLQTISSIAIISHTNAEGIITRVNDNFCQVSGYSRDELIGRDHNVVNSGEHDCDFFEEMWSTLNNGLIWTGEIKNISKDGQEYWVYSAIKPKYGSDGKVRGFISISHDVSERKRIERALDNERTKMIQTSKLATLGEMAAGVAHEINNPLAIIAGSASVMKKLKDNPDRMEQMGEKIIKATERVHKIVKGLKKFSRSAEKTTKDVHTMDVIIDDSLELIRARAKRHNVELKLSHYDSVEVECDEVQISQVIVNLI